ncbi:MAG: glycosyltransferase [Pseudomonadota bacterium]
MAGALRVVLVAHGWPPERIGGVELYVRALHEALVARGVGAHVFCAAAAPGRWADRVQVRGPLPHPRSWEDTLLRPDVEHVFRTWLAEIRPQVVHFHHLTHLSLGLVQQARAAGALPLLTLHDYWLFCPRGQLVDRTLRRCPGPSPARCARCVGGQLALAPMVAAARRLLPEPPEGLRVAMREGLGRLRRPHLEDGVRLRQRLVANALGRVARIASPSRDLAARAARLGIPAGRIDLLDLPLVHHVRPAPPPGEGPLRFLFVGSLIPTKGPHLLLEAFARLPAGAATLRLVGPAPPGDLDPGYAARLVRRAAEIPGVRLDPPFLPGEVQAVLDEADVFVLPSLWEENSPLVLREARAAGLRVVASQRGGVPELVPGARLFEPEAPGTLAACLAAECRRGRSRVPPVGSPTPDQHAAEVEGWYRRCLASEG